MAAVTATHVPIQSALHPSLTSAYFYDAYEAPSRDPTLTPVDIFLKASGATPHWVSTLMAIRNAIVKRLGLKDVGSLRGMINRPAAAYRPGDHMGIFNIFALDKRELLLGIDDRHLDVRVSILKGETTGIAHYTVSTVVHVKNWLGRLYMLPVGRIHPRVVRAMMRRADA